MSEKLPNCTCGEKAWTGGGGQFGPSYQFYGRACKSCGCLLQHIGRDGWWVLLLTEPEQADEAIEYANTSMVVQARAYAAVWEKVADKHQKELLDALCREWGQDPDKGVNHHYLDTKYTRTSTHLDGSPFSHETTDFEYRDNEGTLLDLDHHAFREACRKMWDDNPRRSDIVPAPDPLNVPDGVTAYVGRDGEWEHVNPECEASPLPADPLRVGWDAYFDDVFEQVALATGQTITRTEAPNGYHSDALKAEPWWGFRIRHADFLVGPRKRVINIEFIASEPVNVTALRDVATADKVTYEANGRYQNQADRARLVTIHAWNKEKLVEYLTLLIKAVVAKSGPGDQP